jgi:hypothetical protein
MKHCNKCNNLLSLASFSKNRANKKDGLQTVCRDCDKERQRLRRVGKEEATRAYGRAYVAIKRHDHVWRLHQILHQARVRARKRNLPFDLTIQFMIELYPVNGKCPVFDFDLC